MQRPWSISPFLISNGPTSTKWSKISTGKKLQNKPTNSFTCTDTWMTDTRVRRRTRCFHPMTWQYHPGRMERLSISSAGHKSSTMPNSCIKGCVVGRLCELFKASSGLPALYESAHDNFMNIFTQGWPTKIVNQGIHRYILRKETTQTRTG